jgi:hypothetical protein
MSEFAQTKVPGVAVKVEIDWPEVGRHAADANAEDQALFIDGWADAMQVWTDTAAQAQLDHIAAQFLDPENEYETEHIEWFLKGLLERITEPNL